MTIDQMWERLAQHQPFADARGYGSEWARMCRERTPEAAKTAAEAAWAAAAAAWAEAAEARAAAAEARAAAEAVEWIEEAEGRG